MMMIMMMEEGGKGVIIDVEEDGLFSQSPLFIIGFTDVSELGNCLDSWRQLLKSG